MGFIKCLSHDMYQPWLVDFEVGGYAAPFTGVIKLPCLEGSIQICMYIYIYMVILSKFSIKVRCLGW